MSTITLPNIRVSSDLTVKVRLKDGGVAIDWSTLSGIRALIYSDAQKAMAGRCVVTVDAEDATLLVCQYAANKPQYIGVNRIVISATYLGEMKTYDKPALNFVRWTDDQAGEEITISDPDVEVEIEVEDVSSSILQEAVNAAFSAAERADEAAAAAEHMVDIHTGPAGKSPYIGENGNWWEWDAETEQYVDTGEQAQGDPGVTPDITIGTVTTAEPGTPAAATMTGTPEAPVLNLTIPKGVAGDTPAFTVGEVTTGQPGTPVVVTITGTAAAPVLNVQIPQGMQGNTGSSVDYPYELVNNLTTNDSTKGLSAAQGKVLKDELTQLEHDFDEIDLNFNPNQVLSNNILAPSLIVNSGTKYIRRTDGTTIQSTGGYGYTDYIPIDATGLYINNYLPQGGSYAGGIMCYDSSKNFLGTVSGHSTTSAAYPGTAYVRFNLGDPEKFNPGGTYAGQNYAVYVGTTAKTYDAYKEGRTLKDGIVTTEKVADESITKEKFAPNVISEEFISSREGHISFNMIDFGNLVSGTYINASGGVSTTTTSTYLATQFIPLNGKKVYWGLGMGSYGTGTNGGAVYDSNFNFIRAFRPGGDGSYDPVSANEGAAYIRLTLTGSYTLYYVVYADANGNDPMSGQSSVVTSNINYFREQIIKHSNPGFVFGKEIVPELVPAFSQAGMDGFAKTYDSISANGNESFASTDYPSYLKTCHTISVKAFLDSLGSSDYIRFGLNRNSTSGKAIKITEDKVIIQRYDSGSGYINNLAFEHGLTVTDFVMCEVDFTWDGGKLRLVSRDGSFVQDWMNNQYSYTSNAQVNLGRAFVETSVALTNVKLSQYSDRFRKPVWVIGDSYTSMASARWTWQMVNNYGVRGFLIDGYAGAPSENMCPEFERLLQFGTPKYLVWCLGMNDKAPIWLNYAKKVEMICRDKGITLIYQTIPKSNTDKNEINLYIRNSGYRYIDFVSAVMPEGTWYPDMDDDGTHPTVLGAKVLAGQVLVDFPEITYPND